MYEDDTSIVVCVPDVDGLLEVISSTLEECEEWFTNNLLQLNINKTKIMKFSIRKEDPTVVRCAGGEVSSSEEARFLGLTVDAVFGWGAHISGLARVISSAAYAIRSISWSVGEDAALLAYHGMVASRLRYGIVFWGAAVEVGRIFRLQKACIRAIYKLQNRDSCRLIFKSNGILTVTAMYILEACCFVKKHYSEFFKQYEVDHEYCTRTSGAGLLRIPQSTIQKIHRSPWIQCVKLYNHVPLSIRKGSYRLFKAQLEIYLIQKDIYSLNDYYI